jgi:uncharacterized protein YecE (DUF72 family)
MSENETTSQDRIRIGTSGWSYKEWEKVFYPGSKTPKLTYYSSIFSTAEIDSTFYANPSPALVMGWVRNTPRNFEFSAKLPQSITHKKALDLGAGAEIDLLEFLDLMKPLSVAGKLGPLLIQLPPSFGAAKSTTLEEFLEALPRKRNYRFAIEFRNKSWLRHKEDLNELLRKYNVANTIVDEPLMPVDTTATADFAFVRWHGKGMRPWYNYRYSDAELDPWIDKIKTEMNEPKKIYGYFNNHFHGYAVENSLAFMEKLGIASQKQMEVLREVRYYIENGESPRRSKSEGSWKSRNKVPKKEEGAPGQSTLAEFS